MEFNDVYDIHRKPTGRVHQRGTPWERGDFGFVVCVWVYDGEGESLAYPPCTPKSFPGTWENSGGAVKAGETSRQAVARELREETGIEAAEEEFQLLETGREGNIHYDYYCLRRDTPLSKIVLLPGETDGVQWATFEQVHEMIEKKKICRIIARQFRRQEPMLQARLKK